VCAAAQQNVAAAQIGLVVDHDHGQPRILALELLQQVDRVVDELEIGDEETVRAEVIAHGRARVVERAELRDLHPRFAKCAARGDADERVALEEHDVAIRGVGTLHLDQSASDFELPTGRLLVALRRGPRRSGLRLSPSEVATTLCGESPPSLNSTSGSYSMSSSLTFSLRMKLNSPSRLCSSGVTTLSTRLRTDSARSSCLTMLRSSAALPAGIPLSSICRSVAAAAAGMAIDRSSQVTRSGCSGDEALTISPCRNSTVCRPRSSTIS